MALALAVGAAVALAHGDSRASAPPAAGPSRPLPAREAASSLGSSGNPIPLAGVETSAAKSAGRTTVSEVIVHFGALQASLFGIPQVVLANDAGAQRPAITDARAAVAYLDDPWAHEADLYAGGGVRVRFLPSWSLRVEDDRVLLRDPGDPAEWARAHADYWSTAVGLQVHF